MDNEIDFMYNEDGRIERAIMRNNIGKEISSRLLLNYNYDFDGLRIYKSKEANDNFKETYYFRGAGGKVLAELDEKNNFTTYFYFGNKKIMKKDSNGMHYYHYDILGSPVLITNQNGEIENTYKYGPYGNIIRSKEKYEDKTGYTGHEYEHSLDLHYAKARYLDQRIGRWMSKDSAGPKLNNPQSLNRWVYANNNPLMFIDLNGLLPVTVIRGEGVGFPEFIEKYGQMFATNEAEYFYYDYQSDISEIKEHLGKTRMIIYYGHGSNNSYASFNYDIANPENYIQLQPGDQSTRIYASDISSKQSHLIVFMFACNSGSNEAFANAFGITKNSMDKVFVGLVGEWPIASDQGKVLNEILEQLLEGEKIGDAINNALENILGIDITNKEEVGKYIEVIGNADINIELDDSYYDIPTPEDFWEFERGD